MEENQLYTPVRVIKNSHTSLTGKISSLKTDRIHSFESSLERDFIHLTNFNPNVSTFIEQPIEIRYLNDENQERSYTPDFLVFYKNDNPNVPEICPMLIEIKYRADIKKKWKELKPKFVNAMKYCDEMKWKFKIMTEVEIRTDLLFNAKFLSGYTNSSDVRIEDVRFLMYKLKNLKESTPKELLAVCTKVENRKGYLLFTLWHLVADYLIGADLTKKVDMNTLIWSHHG